MSNALLKVDCNSIAEFYDRNAPAFYGEIVRIVKHEKIAERILEKVFIDAAHQKINTPPHLTAFTAVLNHSRKKSIRTLKAIKFLQACNFNAVISTPASGKLAIN